MPRDGSGNYNLPSGNPVVPNTIISSSGWGNPTMSDIAAALTASIARDGQTVPTANLPMGNFRHTGVSNAAAVTDYAAAGQVINGAFEWLTGIAGTDTITASLAPAPTGYAAGQTFRFSTVGANTATAPTLNINGLGAKPIKGIGGIAIAPGDIPNASICEVTFDGTNFQLKSVSAYDGQTLGNILLSRVNRSVDSIAALRALSHLTYTRAQYTGYYFAGDGATGNVYYDPTDTTSGAYFTGSIAPITAPAAPTLGSAAGGTLAATTYYVKVTYVTAAGETLPSAESSLAVAVNNVLTVTSPSAQAGATGYNVYVSTSAGTETKQNSTPIAIGTNWTEPTSGLVSNGAPPATGTAGSLLTVSAVTNGTLSVGQQVNGSGNVTMCYIAGQVSGTGGTGTYTVTGSQTVASQTLAADNGVTTFVAYDGGRWKLEYLEGVSFNQAGAKGDGSTLDTYPCQSAITAVKNVYGRAGATYVVGTLNVGSNTVIRDANFMTVAGNFDFTSPITIDGTTSAKTNILIENVNINGNRANQTNITTATEDGGRHGFRILGYVSNLTIRDSSATYCAGDGIELFSNGATSASDLNFAFQNVLIENCTFNWNRRHGGSADSLQNVTFRKITAQNNGKDLNTTDPYSTGTRGARNPLSLAGNLYGGPMDIEGYGIGSNIWGLLIEDCDLTLNVRPLLIIDQDASVAGWRTRRDITVRRCKLDPGMNLAAFAPEPAIYLGPLNAANANKGVYYQGVKLEDNECQSYVSFRSCRHCRSDATFYGTDGQGNVGYALYSQDIVFESRMSEGMGAEQYFIDANSSNIRSIQALAVWPNPAPAVSIVFSSASGAVGSMTSQSATVVETLPGKRARYKGVFKYTTTTAAAGNYTSLSISLPTGYTLESFEGTSVIYNSNGKPSASSAQVQYGVITFMCEGVDAMGGEVVFVVKQA